MVNLLIGIAVVVLVVVIVRGVWRATAAQKGTGCPCCDKVLGADHDHAGDADHDHASQAHEPQGATGNGKS